jgi:hypothetical protein
METDEPEWGRTVDDLRTLDDESGPPAGTDHDRRGLPPWLIYHPRTTTLSEMGKRRNER